MKKIILTIGILSSLMISKESFAQLNIKETAKDSVVWQNEDTYKTIPKLIHFYENLDNYTFYYQNEKYSSITDIDYISFNDLSTTIQYFELLKDVVTNDKDYNIELNDTQWIIEKSGSRVFIFSSYTYFYLSEKQIDSILLTIKNK
jgi:hypothetical protein